MSVINKIFVCEFITAGGLNHTELPPQLAYEGTLMRDALLQNLSDLPYSIVTALDARLKPPLNCKYSLVQAQDDPWAIWQDLMKNADAIWLIAPETDGLLAKLNALATRLNKPVFGAGVEAIHIAASKLNTFQTLSKHNLPVVPTYTLSEYLQLSAETGSWVTKSDDGAGCEQTYFFTNTHELSQHLKESQPTNRIIQPYIAGIPGSISCVMQQGRARVLSCNQQLIVIENGVFGYHGSIVNGLNKHRAACEALADKVAQAMPELAGYVGIDIIVADESGQAKLVLMEINPRLTTSYAGLNAAIGQNPAKLIIDFMTDNDCLWPILETQQVRITV